MLAPFMSHLTTSIRALLRTSFPAAFDGFMGNLAVVDCFVVKYSCGVLAAGAASAAGAVAAEHQVGHKRPRADSTTANAHDAAAVGPQKQTSTSQTYLPVHADQSSHSLIVPLNAPDEYSGGGTSFIDSRVTLRPPQGHVLAFPGHLFHGGEPITSGTRYVQSIAIVIIGGPPSRAALLTPCPSGVSLTAVRSSLLC